MLGVGWFFGGLVRWLVGLLVMLLGRLRGGRLLGGRFIGLFDNFDLRKHDLWNFRIQELRKVIVFWVDTKRVDIQVIWNKSGRTFLKKSYVF